MIRLFSASIAETHRWLSGRFESCGASQTARQHREMILKNGFESHHWTKPDMSAVQHGSETQSVDAGGVSFGTGFSISWQNGPLGRCVDGCQRYPADHKMGCTRNAPNGAFVEDIIDVALDRLFHFQRGRFKNDYNEAAIRHLGMALACLDQRTVNREARKVEGTHEV